ncbi:MAG: toxin-antitoxin (TA) system antitoxin [bacterium]|nr:toxin-antitoxin (TA) system antitoxin [bacterium]
MLKQIDLQATPLTLEQLLAELTTTDEIMILRGNEPIARLISTPVLPVKRIIGGHEGEGWMADDFTDELPDSFWLGDDK